MWTLGIETATLIGGVALARDGTLVGERVFERGLVHGRELMPAAVQLCRRHGLTPAGADLVACDVGPGSYTGLRVGLATAKGLCRFGRGGIIGVGSLDAMAEEYAATHDELSQGALLCPALDAKWNQIYAAVYRVERDRAVRRLEGPFARPPRDFRPGPGMPRVFGDAVAAFAPILAEAGLQIDSDPAHLRPRPGRIALRGALDYLSGRRDTVQGLEPRYLRPTEAETKSRRPR